MAGGQAEPMQSITPPAASGRRSRLPAPQADPLGQDRHWLHRGTSGL